MNLLIVDDQPTNRKLLRAQLEGEGHRVEEASNGVEALEKLARARFDAVISDILMPSVDGFRLCREIRSSATLDRGMPLVLYTSTYSSAGDRQLAEAVGADGYVIKPAPTAVILAAVEEARRRAAVRAPALAAALPETEVLKQYSEVLVQKLEARNDQLHAALSRLQGAHEEIVCLNKDLDRRVQERTAALDAANNELEAFSYSVSHDLRAPLRHIDGFAALLAETSAQLLDEEGRRVLQKIRDAAARMHRLIEDLLELSRAGRAELRRAEVDLENLLDEAIHSLQPDLAGRQIEWRRTRLPTALADAGLMRQVFINLLSNALKYSRRRPLALIEIGWREEGAGEIVIYVRDNGVGFDMQHAAHLFGVFRRLHASEEFEGTGIGLASVERIVSRHGGRVWAEAVVDGGATFYFTLPRPSAGNDC
jgi:signal transduction histidine kinase